ncbi:MAG: hypothetical protein ACP6IP_05035 [Candidatus Njordarchaeia archaeon]
MGNQIRLRYSSIVLYGSRFFSFITGALFLVLISRAIGTGLGLWQLLMSFINLAILPNSIITFWSRRYAARNYKVHEDVAKSFLVLFTVSTLIYFSLLIPSSTIFKYGLKTVLIGYLYNFVYQITRSVTAIVGSRAPQSSGYSLIVREISKLSLIYYIHQIHMVDVFTIMLVLTISSLLELLYLAVVYKDEITYGEKKKENLWSIWLRMSFIPILIAVYVFLVPVDRAVVGFAVSPHIAIVSISYFTIGLALAGITSQSAVVTGAMYPKLLMGGGSKDVEITIKLSYLFSVPMFMLVFFGASRFIPIFGSELIEAAIIAKILVLAEIVVVLDNILNNVLLGLEKIDINADLDLKSAAKSWLLLLPSLNLVMTGAYLLFLFWFLSILGLSNPTTVAVYWAFIYIAYKFASVILKYYYAKKMEKSLRMPLLSIVKYIVIGLIFAPLLYMIPQLNTEMRLYQQVIFIAPPILAYIFLYLIVSALIDEEPRLILKRSIKEITKYFKR